MNRLINLVAWGLASLAITALFLPWLTPARKTSGHATTAAVQELMTEASRSWVDRFILASSKEWKQAAEHPLLGTTGANLIYNIQKGKIPTPSPTLLINSPKRVHIGLLLLALPTSVLAGVALLTLFPKPFPLLLVAGTQLSLYYHWRIQMEHNLLDRMVAGIVPGLGLWLALWTLLAVSILVTVQFATSLVLKK